MAVAKFYNSTNYTFISDQSVNVLSIEFDKGRTGSLHGTLTLELTANNRALLLSTKENSHFLAIAGDNGSNQGAVIEDSWVGKTGSEKSQFTIKFIGFLEYLDKQMSILSEKTSQYGSNTLVRKDDVSGIGNFYSFSPEGLLFEVLKNHEEQMAIDGTSRFWSYGNIESHIASISSVNWKHSYRLNSLEAPTLKQVIDDIVSDQSLSLMKITISESGGIFKWVINFSASNTKKSVSNTTGDCFKISFTESDDKSRRKSVTTGTSLNKQALISIISFDTNVAYSHLITDSPYEQTKNLKRFNQKAVQLEVESLGQATFDTYDSTVGDVSDIITVSATTLDTFSIVITAVSLQGRIYTFTGNIVSSGDLKRGKHPANPMTNIIVKPLKLTASRARKTSFQRPGTTGWRSSED